MLIKLFVSIGLAFAALFGARMVQPPPVATTTVAVPAQVEPVAQVSVTASSTPKEFDLIDKNLLSDERDRVYRERKIQACVGKATGAKCFTGYTKDYSFLERCNIVPSTKINTCIGFWVEEI